MLARGQAHAGIRSTIFVGLFETSLRPGELLTEIRIPQPAANVGGAYVKNERKVGDYAVSAVAVQLMMNGSTVSAVRIALTNVNSVPMRALNAEQALIGQTLSDEVLEAAGRAAAAECDPSADLRGSVEYKRDLTRVLTKRAIRKAAERVGEATDEPAPIPLTVNANAQPTIDTGADRPLHSRQLTLPAAYRLQIPPAVARLP